MTNENNGHTRKTIRAENPYAMILKAAIKDNRLSWEARGILCYVLAQPDHYELTLDDLYQNGPAGRDKFDYIITELINFGYFERVQEDNEDGQFRDDDLIIHESPLYQENSDDSQK